MWHVYIPTGDQGSAKGGAAVEFVQEGHQEDHFVIRLGRLGRVYRRYHCHALAVWREIER
jgi:hypothetical protein